MRLATAEVLEGHVLDKLAEIPDDSIHCAVTSPPYYRLRLYEGADVDWPPVEGFRLTPYTPPVDLPAWSGQLGWEPTVPLYIAHLVAVFAGVRRILRPDGLLWINLGDSRGASGTKVRPEIPAPYRVHRDDGISRTDQLGLPWLLGLALQADRWIWRQDHVWHKPNASPRPPSDRRCVVAHEPLLMMAREQAHYWDDLGAREPVTGGAHSRGHGRPTERALAGHRNGASLAGYRPGSGAQDRAVRTVWAIHTRPTRREFWQSYPQELPAIAISLTTPEVGCCPSCAAPWRRQVQRRRRVDDAAVTGTLDTGAKGASGVTRPSKGATGYGSWRVDSSAETIGWESTCTCPYQPPVPARVLDPFAGIGSTGTAALELGRDFVGIELDAKTAGWQREDLAAAAHRIDAARRQLTIDAICGGI